MPVAGGGFDQGYNAQAAVAVGSLLVVATDVVQAPNDKNQVEPMLGKIGALPEALGEAETLLADTGYFSAGNVEACEKGGNRTGYCDGPPAAPSAFGRALRAGAGRAGRSDAGRGDGASAKTPEGRALYALRKDPTVFGIIKSAPGFRQFSLRGLEKVRGEWEP